MERRLLRFAFVASYLLLMLSFHTGASSDPLVLSLGETKNAEGAAIRRARSEVEASVGSKTAAQLGRDFTRPLQEALTLAPEKLTSKP